SRKRSSLPWIHRSGNVLDTHRPFQMGLANLLHKNSRALESSRALEAVVFFSVKMRNDVLRTIDTTVNDLEPGQFIEQPVPRRIRKSPEVPGKFMQPNGLMGVNETDPSVP